MFSIIFQGPTSSNGSLFFSNGDFNSAFCTAHNIGSFIHVGPNMDFTPSENRLIIPLTNDQISLASSYFDRFFKFLQTQLSSSNVLLLSSSSSSLPSLLFLLLFVMRTTGEGLEPSIVFLKNSLPHIGRLIDGLRGLEIIKNFEKMTLIQNLKNFQKTGITMMKGKKEEVGGGRREEGGAKKEEIRKLGGKARRENKENRDKDEGKKERQKIELGGQNNFRLPAISNVQKTMQNQIPPTPPASYSPTPTYPLATSPFLSPSSNYPPPPNYSAQSYPSAHLKNVNIPPSYPPQQLLPPTNSFNEISNNSSYPSNPPPSSIPPSHPSSLAPSSIISPPPSSSHTVPSSSYVTPSSSYFPPPPASLPLTPSIPPTQSTIPTPPQSNLPSSFTLPLSSNINVPPSSSSLLLPPSSVLTNPNSANMEFKTHTIESYALESEPQLYFDDINCIIEPENSHLPLQDLTRKFINGDSKEKGGLFLGNLRAAKNIELLKKLNIGAVLTVAQEAKPSFKSNDYHINHAVIEAHDVDDYNLEANFRSCFQFIDEQRLKIIYLQLVFFF